LSNISTKAVATCAYFLYIIVHYTLYAWTLPHPPVGKVTSLSLHKWAGHDGPHLTCRDVQLGTRHWQGL